MKRKEVLRLCVACREKKDKRGLIRVVAPPTEERLRLDLTDKAPGRGAYVCADERCIEKALKFKSFPQHLKRPMTDELAAELREALTERNRRAPRTFRLAEGIKPPDRRNG